MQLPVATSNAKRTTSGLTTTEDLLSTEQSQGHETGVRARIRGRELTSQLKTILLQSEIGGRDLKMLHQKHQRLEFQRSLDG